MLCCPLLATNSLQEQSNFTTLIVCTGATAAADRFWKEILLHWRSGELQHLSEEDSSAVCFIALSRLDQSCLLVCATADATAHRQLLHGQPLAYRAEELQAVRRNCGKRYRLKDTGRNNKGFYFSDHGKKWSLVATCLAGPAELLSAWRTKDWHCGEYNVMPCGNRRVFLKDCFLILNVEIIPFMIR